MSDPLETSVKHKLVAYGLFGTAAVLMRLSCHDSLWALWAVFVLIGAFIADNFATESYARWWCGRNTAEKENWLASYLIDRTKRGQGD